MSAAPHSSGTLAGRYEIDHEVGRGRRGTVYRAVDHATGETVALEVFRGGMSPSARAALLADARAAATLSDPCLVACRSCGEVAGEMFLAMEWVPGGHLGDRLARGRLSLREALDVSKLVARGLARLHRAGLVHRNLRPDNVLLFEGSLWRAKLSGVRPRVPRPVDGGEGTKLEGATPGFTSPQALRTGEASARDDVYSLGAIVFRCIAGRMPFPEHDHPDLAHVEPRSKSPRRLADLVPNLPQDLYDLVGSLLAHDPESRPADAVSACLHLHDLARQFSSYDKITEAELDARTPALPPHFEVTTPGRPAPEIRAPQDLKVDPDALKGPFVLLDPPLNREATAAPAREIRLREGDVFAGRFQVDEVVGSGSAGVVYKARDIETRETVALRIHDGAASRREIRRFLADAQKAAQRYHPRVVRVLSRGTSQGRLFLAMDWISGETLRDRLARQPLTMKEATTVIRGILEGLDLLHTLGLVHGRLRPGNVFLRNRTVDWVKLSDIAAWREGAPPPGRTLEDASFTAPEVMRTGTNSPRADLYALGVIAFRMLTGCMPFEAGDLAELATKRWAPAPRLAELRPDAPPGLCDLVRALLARDPSERPRDAIQVAGSLAANMDLGWGEDNPPPPIARPVDGGLSPLLPAREPLDPQRDARFQGFLTGELRRHCPDGQAHARLSAIAHAAAGPGDAKLACALCGHAAAPGVVEIRDGGFFPLEGDEIPRVRQPAVCVGCLEAPFVAVFSAVKATILSYELDGDRPIAVLGPTRREVREGLAALYMASVPRVVAAGRCAVCAARAEIVRGARIDVCPRCLSAARDAYGKWHALAPVRAAARLRELLEGFHREALSQVTGKGRSPAVPFELPPRFGRPNGYDCYFGLQKLDAEKAPTREKIDAMADLLANTLIGQVVTALEGDPEIGRDWVAVGHGRLPEMVEQFRARYRPSPAKDERLRVAIAFMAEGLRRGIRFLSKDDDNCYTEDMTPYYRAFERMAVR